MENNIKVTRESRGNTLIHRGLSSQQGLFHKAKKNADAAVEAIYVVSESTAKVEKPFTKGPFPKDRILQEKSTLAERINELSSDV